MITAAAEVQAEFQSTLPLRGATIGGKCVVPSDYISIHAPLTGSDHDGYTIINLIKNFNPRSPYGERRFMFYFGGDNNDFNPRSPYGERLLQRFTLADQLQFQSTLPLRGATCYGEVYARGK